MIDAGSPEISNRVPSRNTQSHFGLPDNSEPQESLRIFKLAPGEESYWTIENRVRSRNEAGNNSGEKVLNWRLTVLVWHADI